MHRAIRHELYRLFSNKSLYAVIIIGLVFSIWLLFEQLSETKESNQMIELYGTLKLGLYYPDSVYNHFIGLDYWHKQPQTLYMLFPLLSSIPYAASYCNDKKTGYLKNLLTREKKSNYFVSKFIVVFLSGFITVFTILVLSLIITMMFYPLLPPEAITSKFPSIIGESMFKELFVNSPMVYTIVYILIDSAFFGLVALISLIVGMFTNFSFVSLVGGTILYYFASYVISSLQLYSHNPAVYLIPYQPFEGIRFSVIAVQSTVIILICAVLFLTKEAKKDVL